MLKQSFAMSLVFACVISVRAQLTNGIPIGTTLHFALTEAPQLAATTQFKSNSEILLEITSADNKPHPFALLSGGHTFMFDLHDSKGNPVAKTELGTRSSQPLDVRNIINEIKTEHPTLTDSQRLNILATKLGLKHELVSSNHVFLNDFIVPDKYFTITNKGIYILNTQIRLWVQNTNGEYGIVDSAPVRVLVNKK
jgi:hypothetical protein